MNDAEAIRLFRWLDRAFWLIWIGFPPVIWALVAEIRGAAARLAELAVGQADCVAALPQLSGFSAFGQTAFWLHFATEFTVYAIILALAHSIIHRCAKGRMFVAEVIGALRVIGIAIAVWPVIDLVLMNLVEFAYFAAGDLPGFQLRLTLDLPVLGVGLLMVTLAMAMRQAVRLHEDAELTI